LRGASKVGASNVFSNSIGAIDAIGCEGSVERRARKSRMLIGRIPDDPPFPCVVAAGFVWFKPAVIDEDLIPTLRLGDSRGIPESPVT
jgi:hypothetical protein